MEEPPLNASQLPPGLRKKIDYRLIHSTRIHPLPSEPSIWIKREDELSGSISGSKIRKYASLLPYLAQRNVKIAGAIGGPNSNNLVGLAQLLKEYGIKPIAFIREAGDKSLQGNALLLNMLLDKDETYFVPRSKWSDVQQIGHEILCSNGAKYALISEGGFEPEALPGAMTLAESVLENERQSALSFRRIYIDCGTGLTAIGLALGLDLLDQKSSPPREIVVTLIAGDQATIELEYDRFRELIQEEIGIKLQSKCSLVFRHPELSPKFGSVNKTLFKRCREIAKQEGLLMDPTYSVKHYISMKKDLSERPTSRESLFIFNGSAIGLMGFQQRLEED